MELEQFLLALCVWREARGESLLGKRLVAATIRNRATDPKHRWPSSIRDVVLQPLQFSSFNANDPNVTQWPHTLDPSWQDCVAVAAELDLGLLPAVNHYHAVGIVPTWAAGLTPTIVEGHHKFYAL